MDYLTIEAEEEGKHYRNSCSLPSAQGLILETRDRVPCQAPCIEPASLSPVPLPLSLSLFLCVSLMNK